MLSSKILELLRTFSGDEMKRFKEFLDSPFHNKNKRAIILFSIISKHYPNFDNVSLTKEALFRQVFADNTDMKFNDSSMRALISDLSILCNNFLAFSNLRNDKFCMNERILKELGERRLSTHFLKHIKSVEDNLKSRNPESETDYFSRYLLEDLKSANNQFYDSLDLYKSNHLTNASDYLTYFYFIRTFKTMNFLALQSQYNINNVSDLATKLVENIDFPEFLENIRAKSQSDYEILSLYYSMYLALRNPESDRQYSEFRNQLYSKEELFSPLERYGLYASLANCCVRRIDLGKSEYTYECFDAYRKMHEKELFKVYPGYFPISTFTAVLNTGLAVEEYDFLNNFIELYSPALNPENKDSAVNYAMAQMYFRKKEFGKTLEHISLTDTDFKNFKFHLKLLALKSYYELRDDDALYYLSDSFLHFINNNKNVNDHYRVEFSNFIRAIDQLVKYRLKGFDKYLHRVEEILSRGEVASPVWLKSKLDEFK